jgi:hypothetical protein
MTPHDAVGRGRRAPWRSAMGGLGGLGAGGLGGAVSRRAGRGGIGGLGVEPGQARGD